MRVEMYLDCYPYDEQAMAYDNGKLKPTNSCDPVDSGIKSLEELYECLNQLREPLMDNKYCVSKVTITTSEEAIEVWCTAHLLK